ncbi:unnamed protein product [Rhizopus stolonifer]
MSIRDLIIFNDLTIMPRNRSLSASNTTSPALISRGFASIRRAHRRLSTSNTPTEEPTSEEADTKQHIRLVPNVGLSSRSFVFDIIDREIEPGVIYRIGRFSDRNSLDQRLSFKSKVVSRSHAELWTEHGKVFIRDIGSSSGTFVNRIRLSPPNHESQGQQIKDGDLVQLGVDYQGGIESIYRAVRIRVEINRAEPQNTPFTRAAFQQLRNTLISPGEELSREITRTAEDEHVQECCICLYAIAPFQALFVAPCSHVFHFKCLRPLVFQNYPGFSCPLCRNYFDLEASVAIEVEDVLAMQNKKEPAIDTVAEEDEDRPLVPKNEPTASRTEGLLASTLVAPVLLDDVMATSDSSPSTH